MGSLLGYTQVVGNIFFSHVIRIKSALSTWDPENYNSFLSSNIMMAKGKEFEFPDDWWLPPK